MTEHELALASELREPFSPLIRPVLEVLRVCKLVSLLRRKPRESAAQPDPPVAEGRDAADADDAAADADMLIPPPASVPSDAAAADPAVASGDGSAPSAPDDPPAEGATREPVADSDALADSGGEPVPSPGGLSFFERHYGGIGRYGGRGDGSVHEDEVWCFGDGSEEMYAPTDDPVNVAKITHKIAKLKAKVARAEQREDANDEAARDSQAEADDTAR